MTIGIYSSAELLEITSNIRNSTPAFWSTFFTRQINFTTEEIFFDKVDADYRKLAPLVVPNVQGKMMRGVQPYTSLSFKPAYIKIKDGVDPSRVIERRAGERLITGTLTPQQRKDAAIADILRYHDTLITNRLEWMAARALIDASVTLTGENYPTTTVDFQRDASLTYTLSGGALWSAGTATPLDDIRNARINAQNRSGATIRRIVMGGVAWSHFTARVDLKAEQDKNFGGKVVEIQRDFDGFDGQEYMGRYGGMFGGNAMELWVDRSKYVDETGTEQFYLPQNMVVGFADMEGVRCFGAIKDFDANLQALDRFQKMWRQDDPSGEFILTQSAPLMVPKKPNASFKIVVSA
jgi:hypothetical protein